MRLSLILCLAILSGTVLSGCMPYRELKELAIVEGVGIDKKADGSYLLTYQIFDAAGGGEGGEKPSSSANKATVVQSSGKSLFDASRNVTKKMGRKLYYSDVRAVVLGRELCASDFKMTLDFMERNHEIGPSRRLFMAEGRAEDILTAKNERGYIPASDIEKIAENNYNTSMVMDQALSDVEENESMGMVDFALPILSLVKQQSSDADISGNNGAGQSSSSASSGQSSKTGAGSSKSSGQSSSIGGGQSNTGGSGGGGSDAEVSSIIINSTAIFRDNKFVDIIGPDATRGVMWVSERIKLKSGVIVVHPKEGGNASLEILSNTTKMTISSENGKPKVAVDIRFTTRLAETEIKNYSMNQEFVDQLVTLQNQAVIGEANQAIDAVLRRDQADVFGFGEKTYQTQPALWRSICKNWSQDIQSLPVQLTVVSAIVDSGQINK